MLFQEDAFALCLTWENDDKVQKPLELVLRSVEDTKILLSNLSKVAEVHNIEVNLISRMSKLA